MQLTAEQLTLDLKAGLTLAEIAACYKLSEAAVALFCTRAGIPIPKKKSPPRAAQESLQGRYSSGCPSHIERETTARPVAPVNLGNGNGRMFDPSRLK